MPFTEIIFRNNNSIDIQYIMCDQMFSYNFIHDYFYELKIKEKYEKIPFSYFSYFLYFSYFSYFFSIKKYFILNNNIEYKLNFNFLYKNLYSYYLFTNDSDISLEFNGDIINKYNIYYIKLYNNTLKDSINFNSILLINRLDEYILQIQNENYKFIKIYEDDLIINKLNDILINFDKYINDETFINKSIIINNLIKNKLNLTKINYVNNLIYYIKLCISNIIHNIYNIINKYNKKIIQKIEIIFTELSYLYINIFNNEKIINISLNEYDIIKNEVLSII